MSGVCVSKLSPIEYRDGIWFKRDDLFEIGAVCGGKARTCYFLAKEAIGLVSASSRISPQIEIVAEIARLLKIPCRIHIPRGDSTKEILFALECGAIILKHRPGYNSVIVRRAKDDIARLRWGGWKYIPFGMECKTAVEQTRKQVENVPRDIDRIIIPVGSGMSLSDLLWGLLDYNIGVPVLGICVGAQPEKRLDKYAPINWRNLVELEKSFLDYHTKSSDDSFNGIKLDPGYEAKVVPYIKEGDLLWVVGKRKGYDG